MHFQNLFLEIDQGIYNLNMILFYILVLLIAFIICALISKKLNIYGKKIKSFPDETVNIAEFESKDILLALDEAAATSDKFRGNENEQQE